MKKLAVQMQAGRRWLQGGARVLSLMRPALNARELPSCLDPRLAMADLQPTYCRTDVGGGPRWKDNQEQ